MRAVIQRAARAAVHIDGAVHGAIDRGLVVLLGVEPRDTEADADWLASKIVGMRIFSDEAGKMNLDLAGAQGGLLVVSQFTLHASYKKGNRPGFTGAARPDQAIPLYEYFLTACERLTGEPPQRGRFGADMQVELVNDGPVTICLDTWNKE
jgi:D-tyrosyl-tRNA(Tyr) deacylase